MSNTKSTDTPTPALASASAPSMVKVLVDGTEQECEEGITVLQACEQAGAEIPRFCYHDRLSIAGNCRMCLVEVSPGPAKPQASCALPISEGMRITTDSPSLRAARRGVMEFLLINHPLDCPICDQGGECDLQDQALAYGFDRSRFVENKRAVGEKFMGPLIKTVMTRCIHCTRCVRFANEVAGIDTIGLLGRGEEVEISTLEQTLDSELSGNVIDLCPVGALTAKPSAFQARSWEVRKTHGIDVMDAVGSNIRIDSKNGRVIRILPRLHEEVNEEWLSDKARFSCDGLARQRLETPYARKEGKLTPVSWQEALTLVAKKTTQAGARVAALGGDTCDLESLYALKKLLEGQGSTRFDARQGGAQFDPRVRNGYLFNTTIARTAEADALLIVGANPREDAPVLNARLRQAWLSGGLLHAYGIGAACDLTYPCHWLDDKPQRLLTIAAGTDGVFETLSSAHRPLLMLGYDALERGDGKEIWRLCGLIAEKTSMVKEGWNGFNILHRGASAVGACEIGFNQGFDGVQSLLVDMAKGDIEVAFVMEADDFDTEALRRCFTVYIGHHGERTAQVADVILPSAAYTEKNGTWINLEGRVQKSFAAVPPPGEAQAPWRILRALSETLGAKPPWNDLQGLREKLLEEHPELGKPDRPLTAAWTSLGKAAALREEAIIATRENYYMTDPVSRASETMSACTRARRELRNNSASASAA